MREVQVARRDVIDVGHHAGAGAAAVLVGHGHTGRVIAVVRALPSYRAGRAVAPGDDDAVRVGRTRIGERTRNVDIAAFVDRRRRTREVQVARRDVIDVGHHAGAGAAAVLVGHGHTGRVIAVV